MIPKRTLDEIGRYVEDRIPTGGFMKAVLENNLMESFGKADLENRWALFEIMSYLYSDVPMVAWGSPERVQIWLQNRPDGDRVIA